jgi:hypothetical protein
VDGFLGPKRQQNFLVLRIPLSDRPLLGGPSGTLVNVGLGASVVGDDAASPGNLRNAGITIRRLHFNSSSGSGDSATAAQVNCEVAGGLVSGAIFCAHFEFFSIRLVIQYVHLAMAVWAKGHCVCVAMRGRLGAVVARVIDAASRCAKNGSPARGPAHGWEGRVAAGPCSSSRRFWGGPTIMGPPGSYFPD